MPKWDRSLKELEVLAVDCQATHGNPHQALILEMGWIKTRAAVGLDFARNFEGAEAYLFKIPKNAKVPPRVLRITGISEKEMKSALPPVKVWKRLCGAAEEITREIDCDEGDRAIQNKSTKNLDLGNTGACPTVIHYSRYEEPFLKKLHKSYSPSQVFPFSIVCTYEIAKRLMPGLPRKSLRAVAGYFGQSLPDSRRSHHHVVATAIIWAHLVELLKDAHNIDTFDELRDWLRRPGVRLFGLRSAREYPMAEAYRNNLPHSPGIYRMYRAGGDLLYIGKAKSLRQRVSSYFHKGKKHPEHILEMLSQARSLDTAVTRTAVEAALLESDEIKRFSPPYNRALRKNERGVLFFSRDLKSAKPRPDRYHSIGPLPSSFNLQPLILLGDVLGGDLRKVSIKVMEGILDIPPEYLPDRGCFILGVKTFRQEFYKSLKPTFDLSTWMSLGAQFWKDKMDEQDAEALADRDAVENIVAENVAPESAAETRASATHQSDPSIEEEILELKMQDSEAEEIEDTWAPERIVRILKSIIRSTAFHIRRSRWFCRLCESSLIWTPATGDSDVRNVIVFARGILIFKDELSPSGANPFPYGHRRSLIERQKNFDLYVFDRMRVTTTEMRRLIQEGRAVELRLHPGLCLRTEQLKKILRWV